MVKQIALGLAALAFATPAYAFPKPPDVPDYVPVPPAYKTDGTANTYVDATVTPPPQQGLPEVNPSPTAGRIGAHTGDDATFCLTVANGGTCPQAKFRTLSNVNHVLFDDPIRNYGQPGASHCHEFFGNRHVNAFSTYATLRTRNGSDSAGSDANATGYWFPCPVKTNPFGDGKDYAVQANYITLYYLENDATTGPLNTFLRRGLRYVFGRNMDDPDLAGLQAILDRANAASGHTRYRLTNPGTGRFGTQAIYHCDGATPSEVTVLKNADGSDPFNGTCAAGAQFWINVGGAACWDGVNLWSPGGYSHVIQPVWDQDFSRMVCPSNYYKIPTLNLEIHFSQRGFSDYGNWRLASDDMMQAKLAALGTPRAVANGESFHTDWMFGWDDATITKWEENCIGVEHRIPHECNTSQISPTEYLIGGYIGETGADGRSPQVDTSHDFTTDDPANMFLLSNTAGGPTTLHVNGH